MSGPARRLVAAAAVLALTAACSGSPPEERPAATGSDRVEGGDAGTAAPGDVTAVPEGGAIPAPATDAPAGARPSSRAGRSESTPGVPGAGTPTAPARPGGTKLELFTGDADRRGITDGEILLCSHGAIALGRAVYGGSPEDLDVYWDVVNAAGGVHGRRIRSVWKEDSSGTPERAGEECRDDKAAFMRGSPAPPETTGAIRRWSETHRELYFHNVATADASKQYSFSLAPTMERLGTHFGQFVGTRHGRTRTGVLWRQSESMAAARNAFVGTLAAAGVKPTVDRSVQDKQGVYANEIAELREKNVRTVMVFENILMSVQLVRQAAAQGYRPQWVLYYPLHEGVAQLGEDALDPPIQALSIGTVPAYLRGRSDGPYAAYGDEVQRFEAAYRKHRPNVTPNDLIFGMWVENKQLHRLLELCGRNCTRNRLAEVFAAGFPAVDPACPFDFSAGRAVGRSVRAWEAYAVGDGAAWRETVHCASRF